MPRAAQEATTIQDAKEAAPYENEDPLQTCQHSVSQSVKRGPGHPKGLHDRKRSLVPHFYRMSLEVRGVSFKCKKLSSALSVAALPCGQNIIKMDARKFKMEDSSASAGVKEMRRQKMRLHLAVTVKNFRK